ncbi:MAG: alpha-galactosidase [Oscillospiraceae bacterium]|nr:alpha-galactosidase [Oscillospiraceae bacterium]
MPELKYEIRLEGREPIRGTWELRPGENRLVLPLPEGRLESVRARVRAALGESEKIFMNGFQTWTYSPEYGRRGFTRGIGPLPEGMIRGLGLRSYGDYFFVDYPQRPGLTHGESWCYFREGERFRLFASLDERPGYTLFRYDVAEGRLEIERDCALLRCGGDFHALDLFYAEGGEDQVFDAWFAALGVRPRTRQRLAGYTSWYNRYQNISEESIGQDLRGCAGWLRPGDLFQIDDGWEPAVGDWLEPDAKKFPHGMKTAAEAIHEKGFLAGLWLAPFVAQRSSRLFREHRDWFLQPAGRPWLAGIGWGGFFALDFDRPEVRDYLERVFRQVLDDWGYDLVKLDFLYAAAPFGDEGESRAGRMIRAMEFLRQLCGDKRILGCGVPLMPAFGLADYCRVSCDVGLDWNGSRLMQRTNRERVSTKQAIGSTIFRRQLNGRAWLSDPDVFFLREENLRLTEEQKRTLATVNSLFGGVLLHSDDMSRWSKEAGDFYQELLRLRDAEEIRVCADHGLRVSYRLDGQPCTLEIE